MKAKIITYETKQMTNSQKSIISKRLFGYTDRTKGSKYKYKRKGILEGIQNIIITKKTFIVKTKDARKIEYLIKELGAKSKSWIIDINENLLK
jgi:hypothetical protein